MSNESLQNILTRVQQQLRLPNNPDNINKKFQATLELIMKSHYDNNIKLEINNSSSNLKLKRQNYHNNFNSRKGCEINPYFKASNCENKYRFNMSYYICGICFARTCKNCCTSDKALNVKFQGSIRNLKLLVGPSSKEVYICNACLLTLVESVEQIKVPLPPKRLVTLCEDNLYKMKQRNIQMLYRTIFNISNLNITARFACQSIKHDLYSKFPDTLKLLGTLNLQQFLKALINQNESVKGLLHQQQLEVCEKLPVVTTPPSTISQTSTVANKKDFYTFIDFLFSESIETTRQKYLREQLTLLIENSSNSRSNSIYNVPETLADGTPTTELNRLMNELMNNLHNNSSSEPKYVTAMKSDKQSPEIMALELLIPAMMNPCHPYWSYILKPFFEKNKVHLLQESSRNIKLKLTPLIKELINDKRQIYICFKELYNKYLGKGGGSGGTINGVTEELQKELSTIESKQQVQVRQAQAQAQQALAGGGKKRKSNKKKSLSNKKKVNVKKVGVYRSKGGYFYRRYKNGKVKRISKETYKKSKKK